MKLNFTVEQNAAFHFGYEPEVAQRKMGHSHGCPAFVGKNMYGYD